MYCIYCGSQNPDDAKFCSNCGKETSSKPTDELDEPQSKVQAHHPWMTAQQQPQEQSQEQVQNEPQKQIKEEGTSRIKSILDRISGWSTKKKIIWGIVVGFLFLVCVGAAAAEPVEETNPDGTPKPTATPKVDEDRIAGKHCGASERPAKRLVEGRLNDPGSLKVENFLISPLDSFPQELVEKSHGHIWADRKKHLATMTFTAENAFGGRVKNAATFWVDHDDCSVRLLEIG